jgi:nucleosome binding factor SPN SPT16 subunit
VQLTADLVESCYTPIIQSGGVYDLKPSAVSNDDQLHFGTIICSLGARYRHYCSNVARTYFVDPDKVRSPPLHSFHSRCTAPCAHGLTIDPCI